MEITNATIILITLLSMLFLKNSKYIKLITGASLLIIGLISVYNYGIYVDEMNLSASSIPMISTIISIALYVIVIIKENK